MTVYLLSEEAKFNAETHISDKSYIFCASFCPLSILFPFIIIVIRNLQYNQSFKSEQNEEWWKTKFSIQTHN